MSTVAEASLLTTFVFSTILYISIMFSSIDSRNVSLLKKPTAFSAGERWLWAKELPKIARQTKGDRNGTSVVSRAIAGAKAAAEKETHQIKQINAELRLSQNQLKKRLSNSKHSQPRPQHRQPSSASSTKARKELPSHPPAAPARPPPPKQIRPAPHSRLDSGGQRAPPRPALAARGSRGAAGAGAG